MLTNPPVPFDFCRGLLRDCTTGCGTDGSFCGTNINCPMVSTFPSTASVASSAPSMQSGQPSDTQSWGIQRPSHLHTCHMSRAVTCHADVMLHSVTWQTGRSRLAAGCWPPPPRCPRE